MCKWVKHGNTRIDPCMREFIKWLNNKYITVSCCCGHGKYPMTVIVKEGVKFGLGNVYREIISQKIIPRKKRFYKRDEEGYYYIPEVVIKQ